MLRDDFPILKQIINGLPLVYLDSAATAQKPQFVIDALIDYYQHNNANVHRGIYTLSERATDAYELARKKVQKFIGADSDKEIIFVRGTTEAMNLVAHSFLQPRLNEGDEVIISAMEHHSNIVPWQLICEKQKAILKIIPMNLNGELLIDELLNLITSRTKLISVNHISNALGTINPIEKIIAIAHQHNIPVCIDGAQGIVHGDVDVKKLDCDFYAFSSHKLYGPTGVGILYGKEKWLKQMPPYQGGGEMIEMVSFEKTTYKDIPFRFEAGTPNIADVIGLGAAIDYLQQQDLNALHQYEQQLLIYATEKLKQIPGLKIIGEAKNKTSIISFILEQAHAHDVGTILNSEGVSVRSGHHCAMPVMNFFQVAATTRASFAFYNTEEEIDKLYQALLKVSEIFK